MEKTRDKIKVISSSFSSHICACVHLCVAGRSWSSLWVGLYVSLRRSLHRLHISCRRWRRIESITRWRALSASGTHQMVLTLFQHFTETQT